MEDYLVILRKEFMVDELEGEDPFLIKIRVQLEWNKEDFSRLITAMQKCCEEFEEREYLERWIAEGFWYFSTFVKEWTTHPNFPHDHEPEYYTKAYERLDSL